MFQKQKPAQNVRRTNSNPALSRRTVLRGMGATIALPWMEAMAGAAPLIASPAIRATSVDGPPIRAAFLYVPNGMHMPDWRPKRVDEGADGGGAFELPKILEAVEAFQDQTTLFTGLSLKGAQALGDGGGDHARSVSSFLTGAHPRKTDGSNIRNGISVDQVAAGQIGDHTKLKSLELGTESSAQAGRCDSGYSCLYTSNISWRTETSPLAKSIDPANVFDRLFGPQEAMDDRRQFARRERRRKSILDFVQDDAKSLHQNLGVQDRRKLDEYLYAVRDIERRLATSEKPGEVEEEIPDFPRPAGVPADYGEHVVLLLDMLALALQTDSTRVATFMFANAGSNRSYRNLEIRSGHHDLSHHGNAGKKQRQISRINCYHATLLNRLLERLGSVEEAGGTLLDNCMILYGSGIADGNAHDHHDLPIALFGRGGGSVNPGRLIESKRGTPLTNLYVSMLDRLGADVDSFSDSDGRIDLG